MPGSDLDLDLPSDGETFVNFAAKVVAALAAIQADLEPRIGAGALDIDTELSMNGAPLTNVGGIRLQGGGSSVVGTLYMDEELHAVTSAGDVQITDNGALAITALGVIGGDYGGSNPAAVTFQDSDGSYWFKEDPSTWADVYMRDLFLNGAAGSLRVTLDSSFSGNQVVKFKSLPADSGVLVYKASDDTLNDNASVRADNLRAVDVDISGKVLHGEWSYSGNFVYPNVLVVSGVVAANGTAAGVVIGDNISAADAYLHIPITLRSNERVKSVKVGFVSDAFANAHVFIYTPTSGGGSNSWVNRSGLSDTTSAVDEKTYTPTSPFKLDEAGLWMKISIDAGSTVKPKSWQVVVDAVD